MNDFTRISGSVQHRGWEKQRHAAACSNRLCHADCCTSPPHAESLSSLSLFLSLSLSLSLPDSLPPSLSPFLSLVAGAEVYTGSVQAWNKLPTCAHHVQSTLGSPCLHFPQKAQKPLPPLPHRCPGQPPVAACGLQDIKISETFVSFKQISSLY